jgi:streptomycin 6-kinase
MLGKIYRAMSDFDPKMVFDKDNGIFLIEGRSLPEDSDAEYKSVFEWLDEYAKEPNPETRLVFNLEYYNSASLRKFADMLKKLKQIGEETGTAVSAAWYYEDGDESSLENAEDLASSIDVALEIKVKE